MVNKGSLGPTCVLKMNLQCCRACPRIVKKQLKKIDGVTDIDINTEKGLVTVFGVEDASKLIKAIKKVGRNAELRKFELQPDPNCTCNYKSKHNDDHSDSYSDYGDGNVNAALAYNVAAGHGYHQYPQIAMPAPCLPYPNARLQRYRYAPPMAYERQLPYHNNNNYYQEYRPQAQLLQPPFKYGGGVHGGVDGNNIVHTFSDLNVNGCTIS